MKPLCLKVKLWGFSTWHYCVIAVVCEGPCKQWRRNENVELSITECTALLKQQPEQKNTNQVSLEQKIEQGMLLM